MGAKISRLAGLAALVYGIGLLTLPGLWMLFGERHWPLILLRYMPSLALCLPLLLLFPLQKGRRRRLACLLAFAISVLGFMRPEMPFRAQDGGPAYSVMTYNIRCGLEGADKIADYLRQSQIDILALQEARPPLADPDNDPVELLNQELAPYHTARCGKRGELVVYSRYPIVSHQEREIEQISKVQEVRLDVEGRTLRLLHLHLMTGDPLGLLRKQQKHRFQWLNVTAQSRKVQFDALREMLEEDVPTILLGDFNTPPNSDGHALLSQVAQDSFRQVGSGFGFTFRSDLPLWRIDYIWMTPQLTALSSKVLNTRLSDHKPLVSRFRWTGS